MARSLRFASRFSSHPRCLFRCPTQTSECRVVSPRRSKSPPSSSSSSLSLLFADRRACSKAGVGIEEARCLSGENAASSGTTHVLHVLAKRDHQPQQVIRLDAFLSARLPTCSRARIQESVKAGAIRVNGNVQVKPAFKLRPGDEVLY